MPPQASTKRQALQATGTFNPRAERVRHGLFQDSDFFDPQDLLQLKYESLRALEQEDCSIARAAQEFGLSRPTIYQAKTQFQTGGLEGLLPRQRGPKQAHKLTETVRQYLHDQARAEPAVGGPELARRVRKRFGVKLHRRTIEKALKSETKRGRPIPP
jgi:transposase